MNPYKKAEIRLNGRTSKKVANNTTLRLDLLPLVTGQAEPQRAIRLRLHLTDILTFLPDGSTVVNSGGWKTVTTKARLNDWLPFGWRLVQSAGQWYWLPPRKACVGCAGAGKTLNSYDWRDCESCNGTGVQFAAPKRVLFTDGDSIGPRGSLRSAAKPGAEQESAKLRRKVLAYAKLCADSAPMNPPGAGDCFYCSMVVVPGSPDAGKSLGDAMRDSGHLMEHMREGYVVPSLVARAMKEAGNSNYVMAATFGQDGTQSFLMRDRIKSAVASFIFRRLGMVSKGGWASGSPVGGYAPHCSAV